MSKLIKGLAVCALLLVGGSVFADSHTGNDGGGEGPITRSAPMPHVPHSGK